MKLSSLPTEDKTEHSIKGSETVVRTCSECHYRCAGRDPTAGHVLGPCRLAGAVGSDCSSSLSFFPVRHGRVGYGRVDLDLEDANQVQVPKIDPHHLGRPEAVGAGVGRVSAFPNRCHFATDDFLGNEAPCSGCCPSLCFDRPPGPLVANPKTANPTEDHHRGCPPDPSPVTHCGV